MFGLISYQSLSSNPAAFSILLNVLLFLGLLCNYVDGNSQILVTSFPPGTPSASNPNELSVQLRMQGGFPTANNELVCTGFTLAPGDEFWVKQINSFVTKSDIAMNMYGCNYIPINPCSCPLANRSLLFSWNRYTSPIRFNSIAGNLCGGFNVGGNSEIKFLLIEVTYATPIKSPDFSNGFDLQITRSIKPYYKAATYTLMASGTIPADTSSYNLDTCIIIPSTQSATVRTIGFRPRTSTYGRLVSAYIQHKTGDVLELGRANPQFPQTYYIANDYYDLNPGDTIVLRCVYNTSGTSQPIKETCMMNIVWVVETSLTAKSTSSFLKGSMCTSDQLKSIPISSTQLIPDNAVLKLQVLFGNQIGKISIDSSHYVNLDLETFEKITL